MPPAEKWLSQLSQSPRLWKDFVPLAFHVDYWDWLGWPDRFAAKAHTARQRAYAAAWRNGTVYTPGFVLDGAEWSGRSVEEIGAAAGRVGVLKVNVGDDQSVSVKFSPLAPAKSYDAHVAVLGFDLAVRVRAGENSGRELRHDFVVLTHEVKTMHGEAGILLTELKLPSQTIATKNGDCRLGHGSRNSSPFASRRRISAGQIIVSRSVRWARRRWHRECSTSREPSLFHMTPAFNLDTVLTTMLQTAEAVSDCLFIVGRAPQIEVFGKLRSVEIASFGATLQPGADRGDCAEAHGRQRAFADGTPDTWLLRHQLRAAQRRPFSRQCVQAKRASRHRDAQTPDANSIARRIEIAAGFRQIIKEKNGLVFVTGATGNGKTTTLAAMLNELNLTEDQHIVTLEDPIEFLHPHRRCTFSQRELGKDFSDFSTGLRAALRQAPKVIFVGEIRDRETMEIALTAAETGHVVYATLHTISASLSVNRILGFFGQEEEDQVRQRLADVLRYIVSQRLVPRVNGGRHLVTEVMGSNLRSREAILLGESEIRDIHEIMEVNSPAGWHSFEQSLLTAFKEKKVSEETAMLYSVNKNAMRGDLDQAKKEMFPVEDMDTGLKLDRQALHMTQGATPKLM